MRFPLYLPTDTPSLNHIKRGSALVGPPEELAHEYRADQITIYYEGGNGSSNIVTLADRALIAAFRLLSLYPTSALTSAQREELQLIGYFDLQQGSVTLVDQALAPTLSAWLDKPALDTGELLTSQDAASRRRELASALTHPNFQDQLSFIKPELARLDAEHQATMARVLKERRDSQVSRRLR